VGARLQSFHSEHLFLLLGFLFLVGSALADLTVQLGKATAYGGHSGSDLQMTFLVNFVPMGIAFIVWGLASHDSAPFLQGRRGLAVLAVLVASLADGAIHLYAFNTHLDHPAIALFFGVVAPVQVLGALRVPRASPAFLRAWALFTAALVAAYVVSRTTAITGEIEPVETLGLLSKALELLLLGAVFLLLRPVAVPKRIGVAAGR